VKSQAQVLSSDPVNAVLFGLSDDLVKDLRSPLAQCCSKVEFVHGVDGIGSSSANIIFCGADAATVNQLRSAKPQAPIVVVSRNADVEHWLDSMDAGATDYCAAPFEAAQVKWIVEASMRSTSRLV
jgi:DNA-binding NarL/FixJ family response regulator